MSLLNTHLFSVSREQTCISKRNYITSNSYTSLIKLVHFNGLKITARDAMTAIKLNFGKNWSRPSSIDWYWLGGHYEIAYRPNSKKTQGRKRS